MPSAGPGCVGVYTSVTGSAHGSESMAPPTLRAQKLDEANVDRTREAMVVAIDAPWHQIRESLAEHALFAHRNV